uniref:Si:ch211-27e6.1 n=1 Tax=Erpetoichthys calabaricus TaxID=27687 RepID=A0A8C4RVS6_ERPCA
GTQLETCEGKISHKHSEVFSSHRGPQTLGMSDQYHLTEISTLFLFCRYNIKALIGRGSFSRVVRVEHRATKQPFAIKIIETKAKEGREVCESELNVLRRVSHRNIIQLMEVFESHERVYMVMELATGGELFDRIIAKGSFTERDATRVLQMVLDSIKYLHSLGITHRDLKPENLLYYHPGVDSKILVTDFGLASSGNKAGDWLMRTTCGTPEYIAPEILLRKPYTNAVDAWALGVITYIMLSGSMPFEEENRTRLYRMILKGRYSFAGEVRRISFRNSIWTPDCHTNRDFSDIAFKYIDSNMELVPLFAASTLLGRLSIRLWGISGGICAISFCRAFMDEKSCLAISIPVYPSDVQWG